MSLRDESGSMLIEALVAATVLTVGLLGILAATGSGKSLTSEAQRHQAAYAVAQGELERLAAEPWATLALRQAPAPEADATPQDPAPSTPAAYLTGCSASACTHLDVRQDPRDRTSPRPAGVTAPEPLLVNAASDVEPRETGRGDGMVVHRYVTEATDQCAVVASVRTCPRRLLVAVTPPPAPGGRARKPVWVTTIATDPEVTPQ